MKEKIGKTAGKIWDILQKEEEVAISRFPKMLDEKTSVVQQALGWLAREDKIDYRQEANRTLISLKASERRS
ncbi:MAG TPA: winged helix-turn-helix domain-containing protein [Acidobacteriota bacterium]|nr:winged helix-turn-helix domain-containing protein [Acidobacteriota bacterium]